MNRFKGYVGDMPSLQPHPGYRGDDPHLASVAGELSLVGMPRLNVMLVGSADKVRLVLQTHVSSLQTPVVTWLPGEPLVLPVVERTGTLILHEVGALTLHDQLQLLEWSGSAMRRTQVISTTSSPLLGRVSARGFIDALYYRLNTVYLDLNGAE